MPSIPNPWASKTDGVREHGYEKLASQAEMMGTITLRRSSAAEIVKKGEHDIKALVVMVTEEQAKEQVLIFARFHCSSLAAVADSFEFLCERALRAVAASAAGADVGVFG